MTKTGWSAVALAAVAFAGVGTMLSPSHFLDTFLDNASQAAAPSPAPSAGPVPPTRVGVNLGLFASWSGERNFANLLVGDAWRSSAPGWPSMDPANLTREGWVRSLAPRSSAYLPFTKPEGSYAEKAIRCTYAGSGKLSGGGAAKLVGGRSHAIDLIIYAGKTQAWLTLDQTDPADPIRNIDCREPTLAPGAVFTPDFLATLKGFPVVRFMNWQQVNANRGGSWATRTLPGSQQQKGLDGVAVEHMVLLANQVGFAPWFTMPYAADADYIENFARYVHDHLDRQQLVYVEFGNEIWNGAFPAARQAAQEGLSQKLDSDETKARMLRYAEKTRDALAIWTRVFADNPKRLVRVAAAQSRWTLPLEIVMGYKPLLPYVDAVATAPYFATNMNGPQEDLGAFFARLDAGVDKSIDEALAAKAIATRYGKRYIAYESGQHLQAPGQYGPLMQQIQRDPRMGQAYTRYLTAWKKRVGDTIMLYALTGAVDVNGSWGLQEYSGQPIAQAPKMQAARAFAAQ